MTLNSKTLLYINTPHHQTDPAAATARYNDDPLVFTEENQRKYLLDAAKSPEERALLIDLNRHANLAVCNAWSCGNLSDMSLSQYGTLNVLEGEDVPFRRGALWSRIEKNTAKWPSNHSLSHERGSERASERVSAAEGASEAISPEQTNE